jgi:hypothetical protein
MGTGSLVEDEPVEYQLSGALEAATTWIVVGFSLLNAPFEGGTLVPDLNPPGFAIPLFTNGAGDLTVGGIWPTGVPSDFTIYVQFWIEDPAAIFGWSASNAVAGTTP